MSVIALAIFSLFVFAARVCLRKVTRNEALLMGFVLAHVVLIQLQRLISEGNIIFDLRYQAPAFPLLYGWCAYPFVLACRRWKLLILPSLALLVTLVALTYPSVEPDRRTRKAGLEIYRWAGEVIKSNWGDRTARPVRERYRRYYRPVLGPAVAAPPAVAYFARGHQNYGPPKWWESPVDEWLELPDYIFMSPQQEQEKSYVVIEEVCRCSPWYEKIAEKDFGSFKCSIYGLREIHRKKLYNGND